MSQEAINFKNQGNKAFQEGRFQEAVEFFTKAIEINPQDHIFFSNRSGAYSSLNQYEEALEDADMCISLKPDWGKGYQRKGLAEFYLKNYEESIKTYEKGLTFDPVNQQLKEGLERSQEEAEKAKSSGTGGGFQDQTFINNMLLKLQKNPKTAEYLKDPKFMMSLKLLQSNPQMFTTLMQQDPRIMEALTIMMDGVDLSQMKGKMPQNFEEEPAANQQEDGFIQKEEEHDHSHCSGHQHQEKTQESHKPQQESHKHQTESQKQQKEDSATDEAEEWKTQGNNLYAKKEYIKSIECYDKAIELKPQDILYYSNKAAAYTSLNELDIAQQVIDNAIDIAQKNEIKNFDKLAKVYARKAYIYQKQDLFAQAVEWYHKSLLEDNQQKIREELKKCEKLLKDQEAKNYVNPALGEAANERAKEFFLKGDFAGAMTEYNEAIMRNPNEARYYSNRGTCYIKLMSFHLAVKDFEKALELTPNSVKILIKKATCHHAMKEFHKAVDLYNQALKIEPENQECKDGLLKTQTSIYSGSEEEQKQRAEKAMQDPEIQQILMTGEVRNALQAIQQNPQEAMKVMRDPQLGPKIQKLIAAGILKVG